MKIFIDIITDTRWDCFVRTKSAGEVQIRRHHQLERLLCHLWTSLLTEPRLWCNKAPPYDLINQGKNQSETTWYQCHKCKESGSFPGLSDVWIVCKQKFSMKINSHGSVYNYDSERANIFWSVNIEYSYILYKQFIVELWTS